jgi:hypothetical protein
LYCPWERVEDDIGLRCYVRKGPERQEVFLVVGHSFFGNYLCYTEPLRKMEFSLRKDLKSKLLLGGSDIELQKEVDRIFQAEGFTLLNPARSRFEREVVL